MTGALLHGRAEGSALVLTEPLSMWGGLDATTGEIIDRRHPQVGETVSGRVLFLRWGRGSSTASAVLAEAIRLGTGPAAIVMVAPDEILLVGALVAEELYATTCPILVVDEAEYDRVRTGQRVAIEGDRLSVE